MYDGDVCVFIYCTGPGPGPGRKLFCVFVTNLIYKGRMHVTRWLMTSTSNYLLLRYVLTSKRNIASKHTEYNNTCII